MLTFKRSQVGWGVVVGERAGGSEVVVGLRFTTSYPFLSRGSVSFDGVGYQDDSSLVRSKICPCRYFEFNWGEHVNRPYIQRLAIAWLKTIEEVESLDVVQASIMTLFL